MITIKAKINFSNMSVPPIIPAVQGDTGRVIQFELSDFTIPNGATATYYVQKPSGEAVYNNATISGNNVLVELTAQSIIEIGENYGQVRILRDEDVVTSFDFILLVKTFRGIDATQSTTEMNIFDKAVQQAQETISSTVTEAEEAIEAAAQEAEAYIAQAIDPTLSITDKAADAKVTGDALECLAPAYSNSAQYVAGQLALKDFLLYYRKNDAGSWGDESWNASNWYNTTLAGALLTLFTQTIAPWWNRFKDHAVGEYCVREQWMYRCKEPISGSPGSPATWDDSKWEVVTVSEMLAALNESLTKKAPLTGTAQDLVSGSAEQLLSDVYTEDSAPYLFRANPTGSDREFDEIVGATVAWNQLVGSDTSSVTVTSGHKLYTVIGGTASIVASDGTAISVTGGTDMVVDLTAWFGSTIADYAYTLEQATAGSGVAWIKQYLPSGYIPYSAPTLKSIEGLAAHVTRGKNQIDAANITFTAGIRGDDGSHSSSSASHYSSEIPVIPCTQYTLGGTIKIPSSQYRIYYLTQSKGWISRTSALSATSYTFTTPENCGYVQLQVANEVDLTQAQLELGSTATDYVPYSAHSYALDSTKTLRGILKKDANNRLYADGDVYGADGTVNVRFGEVDLGSLNWSYDSTYAFFYHNTSSDLEQKSNSGYMCSKYVSGGAKADSQMADVAVGIYSHSTYIYVKDTAYTDAALFKASLAGVKLVYEKATPTTETADPFVSPQICDPDGTEEYVYADGGSGLPVGHNSKYPKNLRSEIERVSVEVPALSATTDGTYTLKATIASGVKSYAWVMDT